MYVQSDECETSVRSGSSRSTDMFFLILASDMLSGLL